MTQQPSLSTDQLRQHIKFLQFVHTSPGGGDELYCGSACAIDRYVNLWLPLVAENPEAVLVPPLDIAWRWHCHRLSPLRYARYCYSRFGKRLETGKAAFSAQTQDPDTNNLIICGQDGTAAAGTQKMWEDSFQSETFFYQPTELVNDGNLANNKVCDAHDLNYDIAACSSRQKSFLWQISGPNFNDETFLQQATKRYTQFLNLMKVHGLESHFFVPS